jgi:hypothetical protein
VTRPHDEREDYAERPFRPYGLIDQLFVGIQPVHFIVLVLVPCWWPLAPASLAWAIVGVLACRYPPARRNALVLLLIAIGQLAAVGVLAARGWRL